MEPDEIRRLKEKIVRLEKELAEKETGGLEAGDINTKGDVFVGNKYEIIDKTETSPEKLRKRYLERLIHQTGILTLQGIDPKAASESDDALSLDAVYTALLTQTADRNKAGHGPREAIETKRLSALELLDRHPRMALLGDPGSGKTTFVNFVAYCLAGENLGLEHANIEKLTRPLPDDEGRETKNRQPWNHGPLIPVRIILRDFAAKGFSGKKDGGLWCFVEQDLGPLGNFAGPLKEELMEKGGLIMLDGLDEVPEAGKQRESLKQAVEEFIASFGKCRILITSRTYAYQNQEWRIPGFFETVLVPFSKGQIIRFVDMWYAHIAVRRNMDTEDAKTKAAQLRNAAVNNKRLFELAERPLLLTLMASLHAWRGGSLPEKREELYADAVDLLLDWWESRKAKTGPEGGVHIEPGIAEFLKTERDKLRAKLNELAYHAHAKQEDIRGIADIPEKDLVYGLLDIAAEREAVDTRTLIRFLEQRAGLLIQRGEKIYTFPHRTFQEYLAACHLTDSEYPYKVADLAREEPGRWREAALLAGAKAARGSSLGIWALAGAICFNEPGKGKAISKDLWGALLAGQALAETADIKNIGERDRGIHNRVRKWLVKIVQGRQLPAVERAAAGRHLAILGDPRKSVTIEHMQFCLIPAGPFNMGSNKYGSEKPPHVNECLNTDYWMARYPVTNAQYQVFFRSGGYADKRYWTEAEKAGVWNSGQVKGRFDNTPRKGPEKFASPFDLPNHPIVGITWYEALAFTRWLTDLWRKQEIIGEKWQIRLPSEPEWEKAARGGIRIPVRPIAVFASDGKWQKPAEMKMKENTDRIYPWGDNPNKEKANYNETGIGSTSAVGCFTYGMSPYGCLDMAGNVWEWTRSLWGKNMSEPEFVYPYEPKLEREDLSAGTDVRRVLRGGAFGSGQDSLRCAARDGDGPGYGLGGVGFRLLLSPD